MIQKHKNRTFRRVKVKLASRVVIHYRKANPGKATCGGCGAPLHAVPRVRDVAMRNMPKTTKRPERPYGGVLCSACMRKTLIAKARAQ